MDGPGRRVHACQFRGRKASHRYYSCPGDENEHSIKRPQLLARASLHFFGVNSITALSAAALHAATLNTPAAVRARCKCSRTLAHSGQGSGGGSRVTVSASGGFI